MRRALVLLGLLLAACDEEVYPCHGDANCVIQGAQGACLPAGAGTSYCAFPEGKCPSGYKWHTSAPAAIENSCVVLPASADGGTRD